MYDIDELEKFIKENQIDIAAICTPREKAQEVADRLIRSGVKGLWNFAAIDIVVPQDVIVESVHLSDSLYTILPYERGLYEFTMITPLFFHPIYKEGYGVDENSR